MLCLGVHIMALVLEKKSKRKREIIPIQLILPLKRITIQHFRFFFKKKLFHILILVKSKSKYTLKLNKVFLYEAKLDRLNWH